MIGSVLLQLRDVVIGERVERPAFPTRPASPPPGYCAACWQTGDCGEPYACTGSYKP